jgi:hypothetical protein
MSSIAVNSITDASGGTTASINGYTPSASNMAGRNRVINGAMMIDQRNAGAAVTTTTDAAYTIDRWNNRIYSGSGRWSVQQVSANLAGFEYAAKLTVTTTDTPGTYGYALNHRIEGYNIADLGFGTSDAKTVTLSFWVKSSIAGTYCVSLRNNAATDSYVAEYSISSANTWEKKTITIAGPTSGTWIKTNDTGSIFEWSLGSQTSKQTTAGAWQSGNYVTTSNQTAWIATSGATFYITGVQLEVGSTASEFEHRLYGQELALCQRYYQTTSVYLNSNTASPYSYSTKRANPTITSSAANLNLAGVTPSLDAYWARDTVTPGQYNVFISAEL